jgi:hypothetical protein
MLLVTSSDATGPAAKATDDGHTTEVGCTAVEPDGGAAVGTNAPAAQIEAPAEASYRAFASGRHRA